MEKCNLCYQRISEGDLPACVEGCPTLAMTFGDLNDPNSYVAKLLDVKDAVRVRTYLGTEPSLRYIPVMKEKI
nr:4Fe-4S dicluster domain-containing protein [Parasutterella excrementihominis]